MLELDLRFFALFDFNLQLLERFLALRFGFFALNNFLIELGYIIFQLHIELEIALAHLFQLLYQS